MTEQLLLNVQLHEQSTFQTFTVGENAQVVAALREAVEARGEHFIYLFGENGVGRSHLLQACCHFAERLQHRALYLPLSQVQHLTPAVLEGAQDFSLICLDDINAVAGNNVWEEALFHLYNELRAADCALVVSADTAPAALPITLADLRSRLSWGLAFQVQGLSDEDKLSNLQLRARLRGFDMSTEVAKFILQRCRRDMASLIAAFDRLDQASLAEQRKLTIPFVKEVLNF